MKAQLLGLLGKLFPVQGHEWSKAVMLLSAAAFIGMGGSISRVAAEGLFLTRFGVEYYPNLLLITPFLVLFATTLYGAYSGRVSSNRMMAYSAMVPIPFIIVLRIFMEWEFSWVYFALYAFVLAYASVLATSWAVYLPGHYDVQEAKRLLPFINSGLLIGAVAGALIVAALVPTIGAANVILLWLGALLGIIVVVQTVGKLFTAMDADTRKTQAPSPRPAAKKTSVFDHLKEGVSYSRSSALFMTTAIATIATMMALQILDFEYSKIFARAYPDSAQLTSFLGIVDGLTTILALFIQWFIVPKCIRSMGVQGTNFIFPSLLTLSFTGILAAPILLTGVFSRFTRSSLQPSLRGTTRTLILNAVPRKTSALVRSFNTGIVLPVGQIAGALVLVLLKGLSIPILFPVLGLLISAFYLFYSYLQNKAYGDALLDLLKEDKVHLLDLGDDELKQLDAAAVAAISERLRPDQTSRTALFANLSDDDHPQERAAAQEEVSLAAIELLRTVGSKPAFDALREHLPYDSPRLTAATLEALAAIGSEGAVETLRPYVDDVEQVVRLAAIDGLRQLGDTGLAQRMAATLDDPDMQVRARALSVVLSQPQGTAAQRAAQLWERMLEADDKETRVAALSVFADAPETPLQSRLYRALDHEDPDISRAALAALNELASAGRIQALDSALLHKLEDPDVELREQALNALAAIGTDEALNHMLVLLDDEQPSVQEALANAIKPFGKRAIEPLMTCLQSPQRSFRAKESALLALGRLDGVQADQFLAFWESELRELYRDKLMLTHLQSETPQAADTFLQVALQDAYERRFSLLLQLLSVWSSPEVARLVASGLQDEDRSKRAQALEALESLSERRFTRLFLPVLEADGERDAWRDLAQRQWSLTYSGADGVLDDCCQSTDKWILIGAMLSEQARTAAANGNWQQRLHALEHDAEDLDVRDIAQQLLGLAAAEPGLALTDVLLFLKRVPLFSKMSLTQLRAIAGQLVERHFSRAETIFDEGDFSRDLYLIVSGHVDIVQQRGDTQQTLVTLNDGDYFGDMAIFEERPRSASAVAAGDSRLLMLSPEGFRQTITQEPAISFEIFRELSARLRRIDNLRPVTQD
ncbi:HEAT repeat domain-containing protein [Candidatus Entotheonella palauensis]|uniref:HEAT repeat domain-containing protein n=1 Tax=Candidatus Entotheonella palauensis TaxID=93172 RepID=UPI000B7CE7AD|nr:HEAT repeat domain-containing protein [Candidatus Entotheonella palauensis]